MRRDAQPAELLREKALVTYIITGNVRTTSEEVGVGPASIKRWIQDYGWEETRKNHLDLVHKRVLSYLDTEVAPKQAELALLAIDKLKELLIISIDEAETGSKLDVWRAFDMGVSAVERLLGMAKEFEETRGGRTDEKGSMINLSGKGQTVYLQALQKIGRSSEGEGNLPIDIANNGEIDKEENVSVTPVGITHTKEVDDNA